MTNNNVQGWALAFLFAVAILAGCDQVPMSQPEGGAAVAQMTLPEDGDEYVENHFTVEQQKAISWAARRLWLDANPREDWRSIVSKVKQVCGRMRLDEVLTIVSYHPRTQYDWAWRGPVEAVLFENHSWVWNPSPTPRCEFIREAAGLGDFEGDEGKKVTR